MYEAPAMACWPQVWIFFCAGHRDPPHTLPGLVQLAVYGIHPWMMRGHSVPHVCGNTMLLQWQETNKCLRWSITNPLATWDSLVIALPRLIGWMGVEQRRKVDKRCIRDTVNKTCHQGVCEREAFDYVSQQRQCIKRHSFFQHRRRVVDKHILRWAEDFTSSQKCHL